MFTDDMILYVGNAENISRKLLELINEVSKLTGYKINVQKSVSLLYTNICWGPLMDPNLVVQS